MNNSPLIPILRPSASSRLMKCSGPVWLKSSFEIPEHSAGPEGTAAGELFEYICREITPPNLAASNGIFYDDDMRMYAERIKNSVLQLGNTQFSGIPKTAYHQVQINWTMRSATLVQGTLDLCWEFTDENGLNLVIGDYKYGYGIVEVDFNTQLLNYIIGYINLRGVRFDRIYMQIYQPRTHHEDGTIRTQVLTFDELLWLKELIEQRFDQLNAGDRTLVSGPHCRYCPYLGVDCPADARAFNESVDYILYNPTQNRMSPADIAAKLDVIKRIEMMIEQHKENLTIYARSLIAQGQIIPGYKLINSSSKRTWKPEIIPDTLALITGVEPYKKILKTPKQLEDEGVNKKIIEQLAFSPPSGSYLKKVDDVKAGKKMFNIK